MQSTLGRQHYSFAQRCALMHIDHCLLLEVGTKTLVRCSYIKWDFRQHLYKNTSLFIYATAVASTGWTAKCKVQGLDFKKYQFYDNNYFLLFWCQELIYIKFVRDCVLKWYLNQQLCRLLNWLPAFAGYLIFSPFSLKNLMLQKNKIKTIIRIYHNQDTKIMLLLFWSTAFLTISDCSWSYQSFTFSGLIQQSWFLWVFPSWVSHLVFMQPLSVLALFCIDINTCTSIWSSSAEVSGYFSFDFSQSLWQQTQYLLFSLGINYFLHLLHRLWFLMWDLQLSSLQLNG